MAQLKIKSASNPKSTLQSLRDTDYGGAGCLLYGVGGVDTPGAEVSVAHATPCSRLFLASCNLYNRPTEVLVHRSGSTVQNPPKGKLYVFSDTTSRGRDVLMHQLVEWGGQASMT